MFIYRQSIGRLLGGQVDPPALAEDELVNPADGEDSAIASATAANPAEESRRRKNKRKN
jgi:hypothetical protein